MAERIARRHLWAVELLQISPDDLVLEVGCGHGIATQLACEKLVTGHVVAIDRSQKMIAAAARRNADFVRNGRLNLVAGMFESTVFGEQFDKAFAVNVDFPLHKDQGWAHQFRHVLGPSGMLVLVGEAPAPERAERFAREAQQALRRAGFRTKVVSGDGALAVRAFAPAE